MLNDYPQAKGKISVSLLLPGCYNVGLESFLDEIAGSGQVKAPVISPSIANDTETDTVTLYQYNGTGAASPLAEEFIRVD